jgi:hypothetical protein
MQAFLSGGLGQAAHGIVIGGTRQPVLMCLKHIHAIAQRGHLGKDANGSSFKMTV